MLMSVLACVAVPLLFVCWTSGPLRRSPWPALAVLVYFGLALAHAAAGNVRAPHEWDYACFWLYGHVAAAHQNVYDPAAFAHFSLPFTPDDEFRTAVIDVGFPYPPPSIFLFFPLGFVNSIPAGLAGWYVVQFAALAAAAWILGRTFVPAGGWRSALLVLAAVAALPASQMNVNDAQTNFLLLLLIALALSGQGTPLGAVWQTLALWVKPYAAVFLLLDGIGKSWARLLVAAGTIVVSFGASLLVLGPAALLAYLRGNPSAREPAAAFVEVVNQSLLAIVLRLHAVLPEHVSLLHEPLYLAAAAVLTGLTVFLCVRTPDKPEVSFSAMLMLGLIVYPGALSSYGVMLIVPLLVLWRYRDAFPGRSATVAAMFAAAVLLQSTAFQRGFEANVLVWIACAYLLVFAPSTVREERVVQHAPVGARAAI
jgi:hypothetical protein